MTRPPFPPVRRRPRAAALLGAAAAVLAFSTGACMSSPSDDPNASSDPNAPSPARAVRSRWPGRRSTPPPWPGRPVSPPPRPPPPRERFSDCVGRNDEVPEDGRYTLTYTTYAELPNAQHIAALRKLRSALEDQGLRITAHTERPDAQPPSAILYARDDEERYFLIADTVKPPNLVRLSVSTRCYLPPGAKQQKF